MPHPSIILASQSPRRQQILREAGISFEVLVGHTHEEYDEAMDVQHVPAYLAEQKALASLRVASPSSIVIASDTVVILENQILGKPNSESEAIRMLSQLSGKRHQVITGVCLMDDKRTVVFSDHTFVDFHVLTQEEIAFYVQKYQPYDKAGSYGVQEWIGYYGIRRMEGSYFTVMGLPIDLVLRSLKEDFAYPILSA